MSEAPGPTAQRTVVLPEALWRRREAEHVRAVDELTAGHRERRRDGVAHPVVDFLFTYYSTRVGALRRWHPGPGVLLAGAHTGPRADWRHYRRDSVDGVAGLRVDAESVVGRAGPRLVRARRVVAATRGRAPRTGCFGLHEWAMLYGSGGTDPGAEVRHDRVPLRLSHERIDEVVRTSALRCTHFDAFRFFTPGAAPRNDNLLTRDDQAAHEQPGCLHAGMDLYHWATLLEAGCPGELLVDCLRAAFAAREVDMRSSPYDLSAFGLSPIPVETPEGRARFVDFQRDWARRTDVLRERLLDAFTRLGVQEPAAGGAPQLANAAAACRTTSATRS